MRIRLALIYALCALPALAHAVEYIARQDDDWVRVSDTPCEADILLLHEVPEGTRGYYRGALAQIDGVLHTACWTPRGKKILVLYKDGDTGLIDIEDFKKDEGV